MTKLAYVANVRMPTEKAHGYQVAKMCEVFAFHAEVKLVVPTRRGEIKNDLFEYYNLQKNFKVEKVTSSGVLAPLRRFWVSLLGADIIIKARKL